MARHEPRRAGSCRAGCGRAHKPRGGPQPVHIAAYRRLSPAADLQEIRPAIAGRDRPPHDGPGLMTDGHTTLCPLDLSASGADCPVACSDRTRPLTARSRPEVASELALPRRLLQPQDWA